MANSGKCPFGGLSIVHSVYGKCNQQQPYAQMVAHDFPRESAPLRTFRQTQEIVWSFSVAFGLQIFVTPFALRDDDRNRSPVPVDEEAPLSTFDPCDCIFLRKLPSCTVGVCSANVPDPLVGAQAVRLVNACNLVS